VFNILKILLKIFRNLAIYWQEPQTDHTKRSCRIL
jgi:hypothetical protein